MSPIRIDKADASEPRRLRATINSAIAAIVIILVTAGCQLFQTQVDEEPGMPDPMQTTEPVALPPVTMQQAIDLLDTGRTEEAESVLLRIVDARPGNSLALRLLEQIQSDPIALMGEQYDEVEVAPGESLSVIAARELGDSMHFYALARYNRIAVPRQVRPGMSLRIPRQLKAEPAIPEDSVESREQAAVIASEPGEGLALTGRQLVERGRHQQALSLLLAAAGAGNLDSDGEEVLVRAGYARSEQLVEEGRLEDGLALVDQLMEVIAEPVAGQIEPQRRWIQARLYHREGVRERRSGNLPDALVWFDKAVALEAGDDESVREAAAVRQEIVFQIHERALVHYRDHELESAIELWEQALNVDDNFEPAQVYLPRARALQARLSELDD